MTHQVSDQNRFLAKLQHNLRAQIKLSGIAKLPETRQGMVALAQRFFEGMQTQTSTRFNFNRRKFYRQSTTHSNTASPIGNLNNRSNQIPIPLTRPFRGGFRGRRRGYNPIAAIHLSFRPSRKPSGSDQKSIKPENKFLTGVNKKGEPICYECGSINHFIQKLSRESGNP